MPDINTATERKNAMRQQRIKEPSLPAATQLVLDMLRAGLSIDKMVEVKGTTVDTIKSHIRILQQMKIELPTAKSSRSAVAETNSGPKNLLAVTFNGLLAANIYGDVPQNKQKVFFYLIAKGKTNKDAALDVEITESHAHGLMLAYFKALNLKSDHSATARDKLINAINSSELVPQSMR